jgi:hypothetical protein
VPAAIASIMSSTIRACSAVASRYGSSIVATRALGARPVVTFTAGCAIDHSAYARMVA